MRLSLAFLLLTTLALPARAEDGRYVACANGLRCFKAPCPATSVMDVATGQVLNGIYTQTELLSEKDRKRLGDTEALYYGRLVLAGHIEDREHRIGGKPYTLPSLVVTGIGRAATPAERRHCPRDQ